MAKFINKKEQVFDLKLTTYGHYLFSIGTFKPTYYAFYDDNVIYDNRYTRIDRAATGSVTFTGLPTTNDTVTIVSTDGTSKAYIAKSATDITADPPEFANVTSKQLTANALQACIEAGHATAVATATIVFNSETVADYDEETITIESTDGTTVVYTLDNDATANSYGATTTVGISGVNGANGVAKYLRSAIVNSSNNHYGKITVSRSASTLTLTQVIGGAGGNETISTSAGTSLVTVSGFTGGAGKILVARDAGLLTLTQRDKGAAGNNTITDNLDNATVTGFDGGRSGGDTGIIEPQNQNNVDKRIKDETQYLESLVLFKDVEVTLNSDGGIWNPFDDITSRVANTNEDIYRFDKAIGDAFLDGPSNYAPAWKVVSLQSHITSSSERDSTNDTLIPQLNIQANYILRVAENEFIFDPQDVRELNNRTRAFSDNRVIELESMDPLYYIEELNTELLTKNFEIEVFHKLDSSTSGKDNLQRKYFQKEIPQVQNGFLISETKEEINISTLGTGSIEYYFDVLLDTQVEQRIACKGASIFNKQSYYVDIDFDCEQEKDQSLFYDIYGSVTEPEICLD